MALLPGRLRSKNRAVTSISVVGGFRSNTGFRALMDIGIVMFQHFIAVDNAAKAGRSTNDLAFMFLFCLFFSSFFCFLFRRTSLDMVSVAFQTDLKERIVRQTSIRDEKIVWYLCGRIRCGQCLLFISPRLHPHTYMAPYEPAVTNQPPSKTLLFRQADGQRHCLVRRSFRETPMLTPVQLRWLSQGA